MSVQTKGDGGADTALVCEQRVLDLCHDEPPEDGTGTEVAYDLIANYTVFDVSARLRAQGWLVPAYTFPENRERGADGRPGRDVPRHGRPVPRRAAHGDRVARPARPTAALSHRGGAISVQALTSCAQA
jgi:hypothetical protein